MTDRKQDGFSRVYDHFRVVESNQIYNSQPLFIVENSSSGNRLGSIIWYPPWDRFVFAPKDRTVFSAGCLDDLDEAIQKVTRHHRGREDS